MSFSASHPRLLVLFALSSTLAACSDPSGPSADESVQSEEQATIINPDAQAPPPPPKGNFTVVAPPVASETSAFNIGPTRASFGNWAEVAPGDYKFSITAIADRLGVINSYGRTTIEANQRVTFRAGRVGINLLAPVKTFELSTPTIKQLSTGFTEARIDGSADGTKLAAVVPGTYDLTYGVYDGVRFDVAADESKTIDGWSYAARRVVKLVTPKRELPHYDCTRGADPGYRPIYRLKGKFNGAEKIGELAYPPPESAIEVGANPTIYPNATYELSIDGISGSTTLPLGNAGAGPVDFPVGRLDVEDVALQESNGSTTMVRGRYKAYPIHKDQNGRDVISTSNAICGDGAPTHSGVDMLRGRYKVDVSYTYSGKSYTIVYMVDVE